MVEIEESEEETIPLTPKRKSIPDTATLIYRKDNKNNRDDGERDLYWSRIMNNANPLMDICIVLIVLVIIIFLIIFFHAYGKDDTNVSECFLKFKELGCSMVRPTEECKQYLHCLQKHNDMEDGLN